ncbi:hypothetical protein RXV86_00195 [Alisedimentitalea sp. MJ-SS2]|uniref:hypothetical protein n=1 Tax=Aliisedimentitalea sp. MJ-SS2 TaxID=3049795 RepID=UPI00290B682A|nr:hypothetical protein [Alisedimentitalea sp. MJ-SS2]MDU8925795.1 hypothetical protein [Alisedimentitalea sp. MJ-SS2]
MLGSHDLLLATCLALTLTVSPAMADSHDTAATDPTLYQPEHYLIAPPGTPPLSNFYTVPGFRPVDPSCYSGTLTWHTEALIPIGGGARFYADERVTLHAFGAGDFGHGHSWSLSSDPVSIAGLTTVSSGSGSGAARAQLWLSTEDGTYRLVTDVQPRVGFYQISTTGAISRTVTEDFYFGFGDHHYSYVNLSQLEAASGHPEVAAALTSIRAVLSTRPPNVFMGSVAGLGAPPYRIENVDNMAFAWGVQGQGRRIVSVQVTCADFLREE